MAHDERQVLEGLISAGDRCLAALGDDGDIGGAALEAEEELSRARERAQSLQRSDLSTLADRLSNAAQRHDRRTLQAVLATLNQRLADDRAAAVVQQPGRARRLFNQLRPSTTLGNLFALVVSGLIVAVMAYLLGLYGGGGSTKTETQTTASTAHSTTPTKTASGSRPVDELEARKSGCSPRAEDVHGKKVELPVDGRTTTVVLHYSSRCNTTLGVVTGLGLDEKLRLVTPTHRSSDQATPMYVHLHHSNSEDDETFEVHGCVLSLAATAYSGKTLARARNTCE
jgi:hypothetical protein